jgi:hypothetical protein
MAAAYQNNPAHLVWEQVGELSLEPWIHLGARFRLQGDGQVLEEALGSLSMLLGGSEHQEEAVMHWPPQ